MPKCVYITSNDDIASFVRGVLMDYILDLPYVKMVFDELNEEYNLLDYRLGNIAEEYPTLYFYGDEIEDDEDVNNYIPVKSIELNMTWAMYYEISNSMNEYLINEANMNSNECVDEITKSKIEIIKNNLKDDENMMYRDDDVIYYYDNVIVDYFYNGINDDVLSITYYLHTYTLPIFIPINKFISYCQDNIHLIIVKTHLL